MFCPACGQRVKESAHFCDNCGSALQDPFGVAYEAPVHEVRTVRSRSRNRDPYKDQITQLKLQLKQLKLYLKRITTDMANTRAQYHETSAFIPHGLLKHSYKLIEDFRLLGPQQQKQHLQDQILQLEQELLGLEQARAQWKIQEDL